MKKVMLVVILGIIFIGCDKVKINSPNEEDQSGNSTLTKLFIVTEPVLSPDSSLHLQGVSINQSTLTISNSGVITNSIYNKVTSDTVFQEIALSDANWYSSNSNIVQASKGTLIPEGPGNAYVWAGYQNTLSDSVPVNVQLLKLFFTSKPDTLVMSTDASLGTPMLLKGTYSTDRSVKIRNTMIPRVTIDTANKDINPFAAEWYSSNASVVQASQGAISSQAPGFVYVWAKYQNMTSDSVLIEVRAAEVAPTLSVDMPDASLIFRDTLVIPGTVQKYALLRIDELTTGFSRPNINYNPDGTFRETIIGLVPGLRIFSITAQNPTRSDLKTVILKAVLYYSYGSAGADSITGQWAGECAGRPINFLVTKNQYVPRYDITGVIDIQFLNYGLIQGINLIGAVNSDGTMDLQASKSQQSFNITGALTGVFHTTGKADGTISCHITSGSLPAANVTLTWWAVKQ